MFVKRILKIINMLLLHNQFKITLFFLDFNFFILQESINLNLLFYHRNKLNNKF